MMIDFTPLTYQEVKAGNEATGKRLNVVEANTIHVLCEADEQDLKITTEIIAAITGYTIGQVTHALSGLEGMGMVRVD